MIVAPVHPPTLRRLRKDLGLTIEQLSVNRNKNEEQILNWENGEDSIGLSNARKLASALKVSLYHLYLKDIPDEWQLDGLVDFRHIQHQRPFSIQLRLALREARERQSWMAEYLTNDGESALEWLGKFADKKEHSNKIAEWILSWLGVDRNEIANMKDIGIAYRYWVEKLENKRILVCTNNTHAQRKIDHNEYSGFVLHHNYAPLIMLNPADNPARRIFTLLHELAHLLVENRSGVSRIDFRRKPSECHHVEVLCNQIASEVLLDEQRLLENWDSRAVKESISEIAKIFKVSHSAVAVRLRRLNLIEQSTLIDILEYYRKRFLESQSVRTQGGRSYPDKQVIDQCGKLLVTNVLDAYERGSIDSIEIFDVLKLKLKYLVKVSDRLGYPLHRWIP